MLRTSIYIRNDYKWQAGIFPTESETSRLRGLPMHAGISQHRDHAKVQNLDISHTNVNYVFV